MKEINRRKTLRQALLGRRDRVQMLSPEPEPSEKPMSEEIFGLLKSVFGIVPTFLERQEEVRAVLTYKPSDHLQT